MAWQFTDEKGYFISESSVYRILKSYDLVTSPVFNIVKAADKFEHPPKRVNEMWQTDFAQFKVMGWGWYYLCTVLDDFSRYIIAWRLAPNMATTDVEETLLLALDFTGVEQVDVKYHPRLLSDNGPAFISDALAQFLKPYEIDQVHGRPHHPQTQGKIERYHRSMKSIVKLDTYFFPSMLEQSIADFVAYYNYERPHQSLDYRTPADVHFDSSGTQCPTLFCSIFGLDNWGHFNEVVLSQREIVKQQTLLAKRRINLQR